MTEPTVHKVTLWMCSLCLDGAGGMCHSPGCALCRNRGPDMPLRDSCMVETIDGVGFDYDTLKRKTMSAPPMAAGIAFDGGLEVVETQSGWAAFSAVDGDCGPHFIAFFVNEDDAHAYLTLRDPDDSECARHGSTDTAVVRAVIYKGAIVAANDVGIENEEQLRARIAASDEEAEVSP